MGTHECLVLAASESKALQGRDHGPLRERLRRDRLALSILRPEWRHPADGKHRFGTIATRVTVEKGGSPLASKRLTPLE